MGHPEHLRVNFSTIFINLILDKSKANDMKGRVLILLSVLQMFEETESVFDLSGVQSEDFTLHLGVCLFF